MVLGHLYGMYLLGYHRENFHVDPVKLVKAAPAPSLGHSGEKLAKHLTEEKDQDLHIQGTCLERPLPLETTCLEGPLIPGSWRKVLNFNVTEAVTKDHLS